MESQKTELLDSDALRYEIENIPNKFRRLNAISILESAKSYISVNSKIKKLAESVNASGLMALDALHLGLAEYSGADYFCTCDDKIISKRRKIKLNVKIVTPIELIGVIEK